MPCNDCSGGIKLAKLLDSETSGKSYSGGSNQKMQYTTNFTPSEKYGIIKRPYAPLIIQEASGISQGRTNYLILENKIEEALEKPSLSEISKPKMDHGTLDLGRILYLGVVKKGNLDYSKNAANTRDQEKINTQRDGIEYRLILLKQTPIANIQTIKERMENNYDKSAI